MLSDDIKSFLMEQEENAARLLSELIHYRSLVSKEEEIQSFIYDYLCVLGGLHPQYAPIDEDIVDDPDHTNVPGHKSYAGRNNVVVRVPGAGGGRSVLLNSHSDVVPGPEHVFTPRREGDLVFGRGACDAKGHVVTMLLVLRALQELEIRLRGDLMLQVVIEEETGGNGSLSLIRQGQIADAAVVLEPSNLHVCPANRGAVWYRLAVEGKPVHMAKYYDGVNAVYEMTSVLTILREYEARLRDESRGQPLFPDDPSPVVVNLGTIKGGEWPATVAGDCVIEGGVAFLPNKRLSQIRDELRAAIEQGISGWARENYSLDFARLHNDAFATPTDHPVVEALCRAADQVRGPDPPTGFIASCDARLFYHRAGIPTVVFGAGDLAHAHSAEEQVHISDIIKAAQALTLFVMEWCGVA
ncbi:MAG: ArgE/DapE family deacylase [Armatimonadota bacterium]|nr:ArgE/DapE family deacylase [Armatimonadota bacterium]